MDGLSSEMKNLKRRWASSNKPQEEIVTAVKRVKKEAAGIIALHPDVDISEVGSFVDEGVELLVRRFGDIIDTDVGQAISEFMAAGVRCEGPLTQTEAEIASCNLEFALRSTDEFVRIAEASKIGIADIAAPEFLRAWACARTSCSRFITSLRSLPHLAWPDVEMPFRQDEDTRPDELFYTHKFKDLLMLLGNAVGDTTWVKTLLDQLGCVPTAAPSSTSFTVMWPEQSKQFQGMFLDLARCKRNALFEDEDTRTMAKLTLKLLHTQVGVDPKRPEFLGQLLLRSKLWLEGLAASTVAHVQEMASRVATCNKASKLDSSTHISVTLVSNAKLNIPLRWDKIELMAPITDICRRAHVLEKKLVKKPLVAATDIDQIESILADTTKSVAELMTAVTKAKQLVGELYFTQAIDPEDPEPTMLHHRLNIIAAFDVISDLGVTSH